MYVVKGWGGKGGRGNAAGVVAATRWCTRAGYGLVAPAAEGERRGPGEFFFLAGPVV